MCVCVCLLWFSLKYFVYFWMYFSEFSALLLPWFKFWDPKSKIKVALLGKSDRFDCLIGLLDWVTWLGYLIKLMMVAHGVVWVQFFITPSRTAASCGWTFFFSMSFENSIKSGRLSDLHSSKTCFFGSMGTLPFCPCYFCLPRLKPLPP